MLVSFPDPNFLAGPAHFNDIHVVCKVHHCILQNDMAESDPSTQSGSEADLTDGLDSSPKKVNDAKGHRRLGSVRALAIKKV